MKKKNKKKKKKIPIIAKFFEFKLFYIIIILNMILNKYYK